MSYSRDRGLGQLVRLTTTAPGITYSPNYVGLSIVGAGALLVGGATAAMTKSLKKAAWGALAGAVAGLLLPIPFSSSNPLDRIVLRTGWT